MEIHPQRINVIGNPGAGKTTTAQELSSRLSIPHIELDALFWGPNWTEAPNEVFRARVAEAVKQPRWVADGNYSRVRDIVWKRADTVVYLDYRFGRVFWQLLKRTVGRSLRREALWNGNRENFRESFFSRDSILWWLLTTYKRRRRQYAMLFKKPEYAHLNIIHLHTPQMTAVWLSRLSVDV